MSHTHDPRQIRKQLAQMMPREAFEPQPWRGVASLTASLACVGCGVAIVQLDLAWYWNLALSLIMGQGLTSAALSAHEGYHRSVFRSRWATELLGWVGFGPLLVTPGMWKSWHVQAHHGHTNQKGVDPDCLFDVTQKDDDWERSIRTAATPGAGTFFSYYQLIFSFTGQGLLFLFGYCDDPAVRDKVDLRRRRERILTLVLLGAWVALGVHLGIENSIWVLLIPFAVANTTLMTYIMTQHWIRPRVQEDNPFLSTISVEVPAIFDFIHFNFSYHQEHHIFPTMSHKFGPLLRQKVRQIAPDAIALMPFGAAVREVYGTPPLYADDFTLVDAKRSKRVPLAAISARFSLPFAGEKAAAAATPESPQSAQASWVAQSPVQGDAL